MTIGRNMDRIRHMSIILNGLENPNEGDEILYHAEY